MLVAAVPVIAGGRATVGAVEAADARGQATGAALFPVVVENRWGFIDGRGRVVIAPRFESIVTVEAERRSGRDRRPDELFMAPGLGPLTSAIVAVKVGAQWGFADWQGRLLAPRFDEVGAFGEGLAPVRRGRLWGFADTTARLAIPTRFDVVGPFRAGVAIVGQEGRYGLIDREGRFVVRARFESIRPADSVFHDNRALFTLFGKKGYVSRAGTIAIPPLYDDATPFSEGLAPVTRRGETAYIDTSGRTVIAPRYWTAERFHRGRAVVLVSGRYGYIDRHGAFVADPQFTEAGAFGPGDQAVARKGPTRGVVDLSGRWSELRFDERQRLDDSLSVGTVAGRTGLVRRGDGELIREYPWAEVGPLHEGIAAARGPDGRWGFIELDGRVVSRPRFLRVGRFDHGLCKVATADSLGYVDRSGGWVWSQRFR
jgi:hypothetical protein